jgi:hypothetical protein
MLNTVSIQKSVTLGPPVRLRILERLKANILAVPPQEKILAMPVMKRTIF